MYYDCSAPKELMLSNLFFLVVQIWSLSVSCSAELKDLACGVHVQSGGNDLFWFFYFFFNRQKPCWSHSSPSLPLLGRWRPLSLYLSLCDTARLCIFLLCSSSTSPLYSSYIFSPFTCHDSLSHTPLFLPGPPKNQNVTAKTHPVLSHSKHIIYTHYAF